MQPSIIIKEVAWEVHTKIKTISYSLHHPRTGQVAFTPVRYPALQSIYCILCATVCHVRVSLPKETTEVYKKRSTEVHKNVSESVHYNWHVTHDLIPNIIGYNIRGDSSKIGE